MADRINMQPMVTERLTARPILPVYPLMREVLPELTLPIWRAYASRVFACRTNRRGVLVARRAGMEHLLGAVCNERGSDLLLGVVLRAENFVAVDLLHSQTVLAALAKGLDRIAASRGWGLQTTCKTAGIAPAASCWRAHLMLRRSDYLAAAMQAVTAEPYRVSQTRSTHRLGLV